MVLGGYLDWGLIVHMFMVYIIVFLVFYYGVTFSMVLMGEAGLSVDLVNYFDALSRYKRILDEERYLLSLIGLAEKELDIDDLSEISPYIRDIIRKTVSLKEERSALETSISSYRPRYVTLLDEFKELLATLFKFSGSLIDMSEKSVESGNKLSEVVSKIVEIKAHLETEIAELEKLKEEEKLSEYKDVIEQEVKRIRDVIDTVDSLNKILFPDLEELEEGWNLVGFRVYMNGEYLGYVSEVAYTIPDLELMFIISKEKPLPENELQSIHSELYSSLLTSSPYEEFKRQVLNDVRNVLKIDDYDIYRPSILKLYFGLKNLKISENIISKLNSEISVTGCFTKTNIKEIDKTRGIVEINELCDKDKIEKYIPIPSLQKVEEKMVGRSIFIDLDYNYVIYHTTWLPNLGMSAILLRRDKMKVPMPDPDFVKKILMFAETRKGEEEKSVDSENQSDLYWKLKVLVMKTLSDKPEITEAKTLQPKYLFEFILRRKIPITYEELFQTYFAAIPLSIVKDTGTLLITKVPTKPKYLRKILTSEEVRYILGEMCGELLGTLVKKKEGILLECINPMNKNMKEKLKKNYKLSEEVFKVSKNETKRLIRSLIISGAIKNKGEYEKLMNLVGKKTYNYDEVIKPLYKNLKLLTQFHLLKNLKLIGKAS